MKLRKKLSNDTYVIWDIGPLNRVLAFLALSLIGVGVLLTLYATSTLDDSSLATIQCTTSYNVKHCIVDMPDEITEIRDFKNVYILLDGAHEGDVIEFDLVGYGGNLPTMYKIIYKIQSTKAHVIMNVIGPVYSAHSKIAISGDELNVSLGAFFMFHDVQIGDGGTPYDDPNPRRQAVIQAFHEFFKDLTSKHNALTLEQFETITSGGEVYILGQDMKKRWKPARK